MQALFRQTRLLMVLGKCRTKFPGLQGMSEMCLRTPPSARGAEGGWQAPRGGPKEGCKVFSVVALVSSLILLNLNLNEINAHGPMHASCDE